MCRCPVEMGLRSDNLKQSVAWVIHFHPIHMSEKKLGSQGGNRTQSHVEKRL